MPTSSGKPVPDPNQHFQTTRWSLVVGISEVSSARARAALEELCQIYWYPIYAFVRRKGLGPDDAQDAVQSFFWKLLRQDKLFQSASPENGRLRSLLMRSVQNHLIDIQRAESSASRKLGASIISLDQLDPETRFRLEPAVSQTPEHAFDRAWALSMIGQTIEVLKAEVMQKQGHSNEITESLIRLIMRNPDTNIAEVAFKLKISEPTLRVRLHRLKLRYREILRSEVADTVGPEADIDEELNHLLKCL